MIRLSLLGTVQLDADAVDGADRVMTQPKPLALLAYLAVGAPLGFRRRDELLGVFWPELDAARGRRALSQALFVLRGALGPDVVVSRGTEEVGLAFESFWCDVVAFRADADTERFEEAMSLYRGDLLPGFFLSDAPEFERWVERERAALRARAASVAWSLAVRDERLQKRQSALEWGRRAMSLTPFDETAMRRLLDLLDRVGDRAGAVQAYNEFAEQLQGELGVEPSAETLARVTAIRSRIGQLPDTSDAVPVSIAMRAATVRQSTEDAANCEAPPVKATAIRRIWPSVAAVTSLAALVLLVGAALTRGRSNPVDSTAKARGARVQRQRLLVTEFTHLPADSNLASAVTEAIRLDLSRSPVVGPASSTAIREALRRMRRDSVLQIDSTLAREIAVREGMKAVLAGDVSRAGGGFVLSARLIGAAKGELVEGWREVAADSSEILPAIERLSQAVRRRIGESLESIRDGVHTFRVTTNSLDALLKHAMATRAIHAGDYARAASLLEECIQLDSTFADAWVSLPNPLARMGIRPARQTEAIIRAYELRDRLPPWERYEVEGFYALFVLGDPIAAIAALRNHAELEPIDAFWAPIGSLLIGTRQYDEAERLLMHAIEISPTPILFSHLATVRVALGKDSAAAVAIAEGLARWPGNSTLGLQRVELAIHRGALVEADSLIHSFAPREADRFPLLYQASVDAMRGKLAEAVDHLRVLRSTREARGLFVEAIQTAAFEASLRLHVGGDTVGAIRLVDDVVARHPLASLDARERPYVPLAHFFVEAGRPAHAAALIKEYESVVPKDYRTAERWLFRRTRALLRMERGEITEGIAELRDVQRGSLSQGLFYELARGYERLGLQDSAAVMYRRYLDRRYLQSMEDDARYLSTVLSRSGQRTIRPGPRATR